MAQAVGYRTPRFLTFKQALELGGNVRKGEHGTKVYFVKQLQVSATKARTIAFQCA
jgi:antirestriction protein ArdC